MACHFLLVFILPCLRLTFTLSVFVANQICLSFVDYFPESDGFVVSNDMHARCIGDEHNPDNDRKASVFAYTSAISACGKAGQWEKAISLFNVSMITVSFVCIS